MINDRRVVFFHHPEITKCLLLTNSKIRKRVEQFGKIESQKCRKCEKKICQCWGNINLSQFLRYRVCSEEVEMFGPQLITLWRDIKFLRPVSSFETIAYTLSLFVIDEMLILCSISPLIRGGGLFYQIFRRMKHNFRNMNCIDFFLPLQLYSNTCFFVCPRRFSRCMKRISKQIIKMKGQNKKVLKSCCEEIFSDLFILK